MSSSTSRPGGSARVLRGAEPNQATAVLALDLSTSGLARIDPDRVDQAVRDGRDAGYRAGLEEGRTIAEAAHAEELRGIADAHAARLAAVIAASEAQVAEALAGVEAIAEATARVTVAAAFSVAEAVVGRELSLAQSPGRDAVARALALAPEGARLTLRLNPDDVSALGDQLPEGRRVTLVPDPAVTVGDCIAEAGWTRVDARIGTAMERVRAVLERAG